MTEETVIEVKEVEPVDLIPTNGQIDNKLFVYKVRQDSGVWTHVAVVALNSTSARTGITQLYQGRPIQFVGVCDQIIQAHG